MKILLALFGFVLVSLASVHAADIQVKPSSSSSTCPYPYAFFNPQQPRITTLPSLTSTAWLAPQSVIWNPWYVRPVYVYPVTLSANCTSYYHSPYYPYYSPGCWYSTPQYSSPRFTIKIRF